MSFDARILVTSIVLISARLLIAAHDQKEVTPPHPHLESMPLRIGDWEGTNLPIAADVRETLGPGDFIARTYKTKGTETDPVSVFVGYFASQRAGDTIHSPANCLPGSGWFPLESGRVSISATGHAPFQVNRYYVAKGDERALVLYWYTAHGREVASEYWAKFYLITDSIRWHRSDGAFIRVTLPVRRGETPDSAQAKLAQFSAELVPVIDAYVPQ
jgi:EpsI family protein